jgi:sulfate transport system substrate-binding protein
VHAIEEDAMKAHDRVARPTLLVAAATLALMGTALAQDSILNASYDVSRELYKSINPAFAAYWKAKTGKDVTINQSHGGSTKQALAVANGLEADVVTFNQPTDLNFLAEKKLISGDWRQKFPHGAAPYTTTTVFLVRSGNPKSIKDWDDLVKDGVQVVIPNPKTSGNGRYSYLSAWGYALKKEGSDAAARDFVKKLFANVPIFEGGGRGATTAFTQRALGDALVTFENEAFLITKELQNEKFELVYPSLSAEAAPPVAVVDSVVDKRNTRALAESYLNFLFTKGAQQVIAENGFRPRDPEILKANSERFPPIKTFKVEDELGGWGKVQKEHFADGGVFDQITVSQ